MAVLAEGTLLATARGPVAIERLRHGDLVLTRDRGYVPLKLVARLARPVLTFRIEPGQIAVGLPQPALRLAADSRVWAAAGDDQPPAETPSAPTACDIAGLGVEEIRPAACLVPLIAEGDAILAHGIWVDCPTPDASGLRALAGQVDPEQRAQIFQHFMLPPLFDSRRSPPSRADHKGS